VNERMKELMLEAGYAAPELAGRAKKLNELIIKECIRYFNEDYQRDFNVLWREDLSKKIAEHFGLK